MTRLSSPSHLSTNYIATIRRGTIAGIVEATPPQKPVRGQIALTKREFEILRILSLSNIYENEAIALLQGVQKKIRESRMTKDQKAIHSIRQKINQSMNQKPKALKPKKASRK